MDGVYGEHLKDEEEDEEGEEEAKDETDGVGDPVPRGYGGKGGGGEGKVRA